MFSKEDKLFIISFKFSLSKEEVINSCPISSKCIDIELGFMFFIALKLISFNVLSY